MLGLLAIFKNESHILDEWINHYINEGVDTFYLINNGSSDNFSKIIHKYKKYIHLINDSKKNAQEELYNKYYLEKCKEHEWLLVCDLDEFVYSKQVKKIWSEHLSGRGNWQYHLWDILMFQSWQEKHL